MRNVQLSGIATPPSSPAHSEPTHANPTEQYLFEIWREQKRQSDILANQLKQTQAIALGVTFIVIAVVVVPLINSLLRAIWPI